MSNKQVIVIGAGMAGIMAAKTLQDAGIKTVCLEARERIGGRTHTDRSLGVSADLGASWIHGPIGNPLTPLADQLGVQYGATDFLNRSGTAVQAYEADGTPLSDMAAYGKGQEHAQAAFSVVGNSLLHPLPAEIKSLKQLLEHGLPLPENMSAATQAGATYWSVVRSQFSDASDWELIDATLDGYVKLPGDDLLVYGGGYNGMTDRLADTLDIRTGVVVERIIYTESGVQVATQAGTFSGSHVIVTVPLSILKADVIAFEPALPAEKVAAIGRIGFGSYEKLWMRFDKFYWPQNRQRFNYLSRAADGDPALFQGWLNHGYYSGEPVICVFHSGKRARFVNEMSDGTLLERTVEVMARMFGSEFGDIPAPLAYTRSRWQADPFSRGGYSFNQVGQQAGDRERLRASVNERLFFAGEATHPAYYATVHGAYETGIRAARDLLAVYQNG
ncbi:MAG: flavin monoamine oxidase family protein [Candidatus Promineifilaceae bacterium]